MFAKKQIKFGYSLFRDTNQAEQGGQREPEKSKHTNYEFPKNKLT